MLMTGPTVVESMGFERYISMLVVFSSENNNYNFFF